MISLEHFRVVIDLYSMHFYFWNKHWIILRLWHHRYRSKYVLCRQVERMGVDSL